MTMQRRQHSAEFKAKVALEALRGERTINALAAEYGVHPVHITQWKKVLLEEVPKLFSSRRGAKPKEEEALQAALSQQIGQLKVELDWLKKNVGHRRGAETRVGGAGAPSDQPPAPMHLAGFGSGEPVLPTRQRRPGKSGGDAVAGRAIHGYPLLWDSSDDGLAAQPGLCGAS